jgi:DNA-binding beta-propeller fold protein YncE
VTHEVVTLGNPADYDGPGDVIYDRGVLYVADTDITLRGARILRVDPATGEVTPIAGRRDMLGAQDGTGTAALFSEPRGLSMCGGMLYVADKRGGTIRRVEPATGEVTTWVRPENAAKDGPVASARMVAPAGTACDLDGLYVADAGAHAVRHIDFATETVSTVVGTFGRAEDHDDVLALATTNTPLAVRIVGGKLLVMNQSNLRVIH